MKKLLALLLAALMSISMVACGESNKPAGEETSNTESESPESTTFAIGEAFGTDSVECVIDEVKWVTLEDVTSHPSTYAMVGNVKQVEATDMFPGYLLNRGSNFLNRAFEAAQIPLLLAEVSKGSIPSKIRVYCLLVDTA